MPFIWGRHVACCLGSFVLDFVFVDTDRLPGKRRNEVLSKTIHETRSNLFDMYDWTHPPVRRDHYILRNMLS